MDLAEAVATPVPSQREMTPAEEDGMLREDGVREVLARLQRGERIKTIARDLGMARNPVKRWQRLGGWRPRPSVARPCQIDPYRPFIVQRGARSELEWPRVASGTAGGGVRRDLSASPASDSAPACRSGVGDRNRAV